MSTNDQLSMLFASDRGGKQAHSTVVRTFHERFIARYGSPPTWGGKQANIVKQLVKKHDLPTILARIEVCFSDAVAWPPHPRTVETFSVHFDKFIFVKAKPKPQDEWNKVAAIMSRYGYTGWREALDVIADLDVATAAAVTDAGGYTNLCRMNDDRAKFAFYAALKKGDA